MKSAEVFYELALVTLRLHPGYPNGCAMHPGYPPLHATATQPSYARGRAYHPWLPIESTTHPRHPRRCPTHPGYPCTQPWLPTWIFPITRPN